MSATEPVLVSDLRVTELQHALLAALGATRRLDALEKGIAEARQALDQCCEAIYNATLYDPAGEKDGVS